MKRRLMAIGSLGLVLIVAIALVLQNIIDASFSADRPGILQMFSQAAATVSEPATLSLLGIGLLGAAWFARRRRGKMPSQV